MIETIGLECWADSSSNRVHTLECLHRRWPKEWMIFLGDFERGWSGVVPVCRAFNGKLGKQLIAKVAFSARLSYRWLTGNR